MLTWPYPLGDRAAIDVVTPSNLMVQAIVDG